ncbi:translation initiation factor 2 (bIF-2) [Streptomyces malaysiensis]|uniref:Translation initiation factor 2 (BIF-2) n=1 Tax=Streptomyces malaysiensis TaxID=92644 RepID=A0A7X5WZP0_STRMQ|nr:translation initiation factor 2 (bIF-2) [Streptomyces malaysiensis]
MARAAGSVNQRWRKLAVQPVVAGGGPRRALASRFWTSVPGPGRPASARTAGRRLRVRARCSSRPRPRSAGRPPQRPPMRCAGPGTPCTRGRGVSRGPGRSGSMSSRSPGWTRPSTGSSPSGGISRRGQGLRQDFPQPRGPFPQGRDASEVAESPAWSPRAGEHRRDTALRSSVGSTSARISPAAAAAVSSDPRAGQVEAVTGLVRAGSAL